MTEGHVSASSTRLHRLVSRVISGGSHIPHAMEGQVWLDHALAWVESRGPWGMPALALLNGIVLTRAFSPMDIFPLLFVCLPLLIVMVWRTKTATQAFAVGWWTGLGFFAVGLSWIGHSFQMQGPNPSIPPVLAPLAVFMLSAFLSLYVGIACLLARRIARPGLLGALVFASSWTLMEIARGSLLTGFPWHIVSSAWSGWLAPLQTIFWISSYGLSFITVLAAGLIASGFAYTATLRRFLGPSIALALMLLITFIGFIRLDSHTTTFHVGLPMRIVQPNIDQRELWQRSRWGEFLNRQLQMSRGSGNSISGRASGVKLLIWPETSIRGLTFD